MRRTAGGFTLIELVVAITIIAILAAVALPRYINLQGQARAAKAQALFGAMRSAAALAKAQCQIDLAGVNPAGATCTSVGGSVNMDGFLVAMINQYPAATVPGIIAAAQLNPVTDGLTVINGNPIVVQINGGAVPNCQVSYREAPAPGTSPDFFIDTSRC